MTAAGGRPRVVFDCNVVLQAVAYPTGPSASCLALMERGIVEALISRRVVAEWREVLGRPEIRSASAALTDKVVNTFLERLVFRATLVRPVRHRFDYPRDPKDEPYIDLCLAGRANYLVTRDKDLLALGRDHTAVAKRFRQVSRPLLVVQPIAFLDLVRPTR